MSINYVSHSQERLKDAMEPHFKRLGWDSILTYLEMGPDFPGYNLAIVFNTKLNDRDFKGIDVNLVSDIVKPFADKLYNSPLITELRDDHEKELQVLRDQIKVLEDTNHSLVALLSDELEYGEIND